MELIGLSGYARSGKDAAAAVLIKEFGFKRVAFADKLREVLYALNPIVSERDRDIAGRYEKYIKVQDVINTYSWDGYKETNYGPEVRRLLQRLGTEAGRQALWDSIWIDAALTSHDEDAKLVVTDCRFPNEAEAVAARGGQMWRIIRAGVGPANSHPSETSLDDWDFDVYVHNDGTLEDLAGSVKRRYLERLGSKV